MFTLKLFKLPSPQHSSQGSVLFKILLTVECGDEHTWPDLDDNLVCGDCRVLVTNMDTKYSTCSNYCDSIGRTCAGAWEEKSDTCNVKETEDCQHNFGAYTSDAICQCGRVIGAGELSTAGEILPIFSDLTNFLLKQVGWGTRLVKSWQFQKLKCNETPYIKSSNHLKARNIRVTEFTTISFLHRLRLQCSEKVKVVQMMIFHN